MDLQRPGLHRRPDLHEAGFTDAELRRAVRLGSLDVVRPGAYFAGPQPQRAEDRHAVLVRATHDRLAADAVVSHVSAAVLHGLPLWNVPLDRVHITRPRDYGGRRRRRRHVRVAPIAEHEIRTLNGLVLTSPARTVVDVARTVGFEEAVVVVDAALRLRLVDPLDLAQALESASGRPGIAAARRVVAFADGRSESVGESRSRVALARAGLVPPVLQWEVRSTGGMLVGPVDFGWPDLRTVGEFDGRRKYGRLSHHDEPPEETVFREKLREDALRAEGLAVVRWTWDDLTSFSPVADRLRRLHARG